MFRSLAEVVLPCLAVAALVAVVAFFAASETAFLSITPLKLKQMLREDDPAKRSTPAKKIARLKKDPDRLLSLILVGINFVTSLASALAAAIAIRLAGEAGGAIATAVMVFVLIIFGEITPKTFAAVHPVRAAGLFASALLFLERALFPVVWVFAKISGAMTALLNSFWKDGGALITEEELKSLIDVGETEGTLEHSERRMLHRIFDFTDLHVRDLMRHRSMVKFIPVGAGYDEVVRIFGETGFSRLPVCEGGFENVRGTVYYKQVLVKSRYRDSPKFLTKCISPAVFVPETLTATELLAKFKKERVNFAVVFDENGANSGIVTMDDIMRAVFGRSVHEDSPELPPERRIQPVSTVEYLVPGDLRLDDVNELMGMALSSDDYDTLAGWLLEQFDALPEQGETILVDGVTYRVEEQSQRRIRMVRMTLLSPPLLRRR